MPYSALLKIKENLFIEWTYNSNSIEGNTLSLQETKIVLQDGITVRLIMNLLLMMAVYPPVIILKNDRKKYYESLNQANKGSYKKLLLLVAQA